MAEYTTFSGSVHHGCKVETMNRLNNRSKHVLNEAVPFAGRFAVHLVGRKGLEARFGWFLHYATGCDPLTPFQTPPLPKIKCTASKTINPQT